MSEVEPNARRKKVTGKEGMEVGFGGKGGGGEMESEGGWWSEGQGETERESLSCV